MTREEWLSACAARFTGAGMPAQDAEKLAVVCLNIAITYSGGEAAALETSPADAAGVEMGYWEE